MSGPTHWVSLLSSIGLALAAGCGSPGFHGGGGAGDGGTGEDAQPPDEDAQPPDAEPPDAGPPSLFSFFVASLEVMRDLSGSQDGFGGDLGGLDGADSICQEAASRVGEGGKTWRAFLSVTSESEGGAVDAIDRVGDGPWYDVNERLLATSRDGLLGERPDGNPQVIDDLPDEFGVGLRSLGDSHDIMTGSNTEGRLESRDPASTCYDWTSAVGPGTERRVRCGHSWPSRSGQSWMSAHPLRGCAPGVNLKQDGPGEGDCVGCSGGYGGIYCFAVTP